MVTNAGWGSGDAVMTVFFFYVDQFETKFWAVAPPHAKYIGRGYNIQEGR